MKNKYIIALLLLLGVWAACSKHDVAFDGVQRVYLLKDTIGYSFGAKPLALITDTVFYPVQIIGSPTKTKRKFTVEIDAKRSTATAGKEFENFAGECLLLPDSIRGYIPVVMHRSKLSKDSIYKIFFSLKPNEDFNLGSIESLNGLVLFNNILQKPVWWESMIYYLGTYQPEKYQKFIELNEGKEVASRDEFNSKFLYYAKIFYQVKLFFDAHPEYKVEFPKDIEWPF